MKNSWSCCVDIMFRLNSYVARFLWEIDDIHGSYCLIVDWVKWFELIKCCCDEMKIICCCCVIVDELKMWGSCCCCYGFMLKSEMTKLKFDRNQLKLTESCKLGVKRGFISIIEIKEELWLFCFELGFKCLHESCSPECYLSLAFCLTLFQHQELKIWSKYYTMVSRVVFFPRPRNTKIYTLFCAELGFGVNM